MGSHLQALIDYLSAHPTVAVSAVFAAAVLEALAVIGTVIPGSSVVFVGGVLIGLGALDPWWTAGAAVLGAILGDGLSYWLGRHYHQRIRSIWPLRTHPELFDRGQAYFARNGGKSVFLGRFLSPVRAIVPVVAGMSDMPPARFYTANVASAFAWAAAHMLPGVLFGASLQLAGAVSSRLVILLTLIAVTVWVLAWLARQAHGPAATFVGRQRNRLVGWARPRSGPLPRATVSLLDPSRPDSGALLTATLLLLGASWLFLGVLPDTLANDPLLQFDRALYADLQNLRSAWADKLMVAALAFGTALVVLAVTAAVSVLLVVRSRWHTLACWLTAIGFAELFGWLLTIVLARAGGLHDAVERYSFAGGNAVSTTVLYGFLAFLLAHGKPARVRAVITLLAVLAILFVAASRLYFGVRWLSEELAGVSLGTAWVALLSIGCTRHLRSERLSARALSFALLASLAVAGAFQVWTHHAAHAARTAPHALTSAPVLLPNWQSEDWQRLPARRTEIDGDSEEPLSVQWAATSRRIAAVLEAGGWRAPAPWSARTALLWLLPGATIGQLPVLPKLHEGDFPQLTFEKVLSDQQRLVIRLWPTAYAVEAGQRRPLWVGMVTSEHLRHPLGFFTLVHTGADYATPERLLAESIGKQVPTASRHRGHLAVLLIW